MNHPHSHQEYFAYFGFGSLVNRATLEADIVAAIPARLQGWRRHWQQRPAEKETPSIALLSIHRDEQASIDGMLIIDRVKNLAKLDKRESHYNKVSIPEMNLQFSRGELSNFRSLDIDVPDIHTPDIHTPDIHTYVAPQTIIGGSEISILRSYLDVVMLGYYQQFGEEGLRQFIASTDGFDAPIYEDRQNPIYPRCQKISTAQELLFDKFLSDDTGAKNLGVYNRNFYQF